VIEGYRWLGGDFNIPINVTTVDPYYNARTISFSAYSDSQMTNKLDLSKITVYTNSKIYVKAMIKNTGNQILPANITKIATTNPRDRSSTYSDDSWPSRNRTALANSDIQPQNTATFNFSITAPDTPTKRTQEQFGFVIEGQRWLNDNIGSLSIQTIQKPPSVLTTSQSLIKGEGILSGNKKYRLILQGDGNLVLYSPTKAIWSSRTVGSSTTKLIMQSDGNLVLYRANSTSTWSSKTNGRGASNLIIQTDGNLVIYDSSRRATWATYTNN